MKADLRIKHIKPLRRNPLKTQSFKNRVNGNKITIKEDKIYVNGKFSHMSTRHRVTDEEIASLHPKIRVCAANFINESNGTQNKYLMQISNNWEKGKITSHGGYRTNTEQNNLYKKGRVGDKVVNKKIVVTNAKGGRSYHNHGLAFDIAIFENGEYITCKKKMQNIIKKNFLDIIKKHGLEWGGTFKNFYDPPHIQKKCNYEINDLIAINKKNSGYLKIE